jgi:hypothetical protein
MPGCIAEVFAANNERRVPNPDATHGRIVPKEEFASLMMEKLTKELILKQEDATNPEIKSAKQGFAYGPSTSKTAKPYALNTLRKRAKIGVCGTTSRTAVSYTSVIASRSPSHSWAGNIFRLLILVLIVLAPVATAVDIVAVSAATIATSVAVNVTSSIISTTNIHTTPTDNGGIASTDIASTTASWTSLSSAITAAAGKAVVLTLATPFDMTGFKNGSAISMSTADTHITMVGNGVVFESQMGNGSGWEWGDRFFSVGKGVALVMSNMTLQKGFNLYGGGGAIYVSTGGTITLSSCSFFGNYAEYPDYGKGGAIYVSTGASITLSSCSFAGNIVDGGTDASGGAIYVSTRGTATLSSCSFSGMYKNNYNHAGGRGGAIYVSTGASITLSSCSFAGNEASYSYPGGAGGALYFEARAAGVLKNCSLLGTVSANNNDIARGDTTANVTFACADGETGAPVQMQGNEITKLPALTCTASYSCDVLTGTCKQDQSGSFPSKQACSSGCTAQPTPAPCQVPRNCGQYNNSVVCGHTFTGCEFVCGKGSDPATVGCCHANILRDDTCNQCVDYLCKPPPPLPPPVTTKYFCVTTPNYHCIESSSGTFPSATDCETACQQPLGLSSLSSLLLGPATEEKLEERR